MTSSSVVPRRRSVDVKSRLARGLRRVSSGSNRNVERRERSCIGELSALWDSRWLSPCSKIGEKPPFVCSGRGDAGGAKV